MVRRSDNPLDAFADKLNTRTVDPATDFTAQALNYPTPAPCTPPADGGNAALHRRTH